MRRLPVVAALLALACGNGSAPPSPPSFLELCRAARSSGVDRYANCMHANPAAFRTGPDVCGEVQKMIDGGTVGYDASRADGCLAALRAATCADLLAAFEPAACTGLLTGRVASGAPCHMSEECAAGYCTSEYTSSCPGTCRPLVALGGDCTSDPCAEGLDCGGTGMTPTCQPLGGLNAPCPCQDAYWCDFSGGPPGVCRAPKTSGPCWYLYECAFGLGYTCAGAAPLANPPVLGACVATVGGGAACGPAVPCGLGYTCTGPAAGPLTCNSWPAVDAPCDPLQPTQCLQGYCDATLAQPKCARLKAGGDACVSGLECESFVCTAGHCERGYCAMP